MHSGNAKTQLYSIIQKKTKFKFQIIVFDKLQKNNRRSAFAAVDSSRRPAPFGDRHSGTRPLRFSSLSSSPANVSRYPCPSAGSSSGKRAISAGKNVVLLHQRFPHRRNAPHRLLFRQHRIPNTRPIPTPCGLLFAASNDSSGRESTAPPLRIPLRVASLLDFTLSMERLSCQLFIKQFIRLPGKQIPEIPPTQTGGRTFQLYLKRKLPAFRQTIDHKMIKKF
ncbi:hypothetical protein [Victivallis sp. Marseille-Q1083]|uniref:hypothetical protein n=1 Tax=Victivallis sp. Marseille-Q1083 TaxID=2717288 RepID=UPI00158CBB85|nr:hypothetical protein [Victivallis sp. Marseille-Q1083]